MNKIPKKLTFKGTIGRITNAFVSEKTSIPLVKVEYKYYCHDFEGSTIIIDWTEYQDDRKDFISMANRMPSAPELKISKLDRYLERDNNYYINDDRNLVFKKEEDTEISGYLSYKLITKLADFNSRINLQIQIFVKIENQVINDIILYYSYKIKPRDGNEKFFEKTIKLPRELLQPPPPFPSPQHNDIQSKALTPTPRTRQLLQAPAQQAPRQQAHQMSDRRRLQGPYPPSSEGGKRSSSATRKAYKKTTRKHKDCNGIEKIVYAKNGERYVKRKSPKTGKFYFKKI